MYRGPGGPASRGRSKATASTVCQKCLKRDTYECTVSAQERPYKARPSRTQQLLNPNLKPKLTTEVPNDLLRKKGIADELLAKSEEARGRTRSRDGDGSSRNRSFSASSSDSVSTISTTRSVSRSPDWKQRGRNEGDTMHAKGTDGALRKRDRSTSSSSYTSRHSDKRNVRRRLSSFSPTERGRSRSFESSRKNVFSSYEARARKGRPYRSRSRSNSRRRRRPRSRSRSMERRGKQATRNLSPSQSKSPDRMDVSEEGKPPHYGRNISQYISDHRASLQRAVESTSRSPSPHGRKVIDSPIHRRRSPSPYSRRGPQRSQSPFRSQNGAFDRHGYHGERNHELEERPSGRTVRNAPSPQRERSLSPYSKRVALTKAMQGR